MPEGNGQEIIGSDRVIDRLTLSPFAGALAIVAGILLVVGALSPWLETGGFGVPFVREQTGVDLAYGAPLVPLGAAAMVIGALLLIGKRPRWLLAATAALAVTLAILGFERVARPSDISEVLKHTDAVYSQPQIGLWIAMGGVAMLTLSAGLMIVVGPRPQMRRLWHHSRLASHGFVLLGVAAVLWLSTYLPPGTMTSISLQAMAAIGFALVGFVLLVTAAVTSTA